VWGRSGREEPSLDEPYDPAAITTTEPASATS